MKHLQEMIHQNLLRLKELDQVATEIEILTGLNLFELRDRLAAGWILILPYAKDKQSLVEILSEFERKEKRND